MRRSTAMAAAIVALLIAASAVLANDGPGIQWIHYQKIYSSCKEVFHIGNLFQNIILGIDIYKIYSSGFNLFLN